MRWGKIVSTICPLSVPVDFITSWQFFWVTKSWGPTIATTLGNYTCKSFIKLTSCFSFVVKDSGVSHAPRERPGRETRFSRLSIRGRHNFQNLSGNSALFFTKHEVKNMIGLASFHTQMSLSSGSWQKLVAQALAYHFLLTDYRKVSYDPRNPGKSFLVIDYSFIFLLSAI